MTTMSRDYAIGYLAAMVDGEGCVVVNVNNRTVRISNTDWDIIEAVIEACSILGLRTRIQKRDSPSRRKNGWKLSWDVVISGRENLELFRETVPLRAKIKSAKLQKLLLIYQHPRRPKRDVLVDMYIEKKMSISEIMRVTGARSTNTVLYWLKKHGIERRNMSESLTITWEKRRHHALPV